ncbi:MAG: hypothetical protein QOJ81_482 [Chloroflexota bacterium]|jgi:hypothetical protein|nr:hypothetical protein [Chloroflexota bacterium]
MRKLRFIVSAALAATLFVSAAGPTAAFTVLSESGPHGDYSLTDGPATPAAECTYGDVVYANWAYLISMRVYAPHVFAADRTAQRDHRVVGWQWQLQWKEYDKVRWHTIKSTAIQKRTAYEDQEAAFSAMKLNYNSEKDDPNHLDEQSILFRARVIIRWYMPNGSLESTVKVKPDWYARDTYWAAGPAGNYCERVNTDG